MALLILLSGLTQRTQEVSFFLGGGGGIAKHDVAGTLSIKWMYSKLSYGRKQRVSVVKGIRILFYKFWLYSKLTTSVISFINHHIF